MTSTKQSPAIPIRRHTAESVLEVALLDVPVEGAGRYEDAFREAQKLIEASPGYLGHELRLRTEAPGRYLLLVWWDTVESHTEGFRKSKRYEAWKALLHPFYHPFPVVEHFVGVESAAGSPAPEDS